VELIAFETSVSGTFQEDHWYTSLIYLTIAFSYHTLSASWKEAKHITLTKPGKDPTSSQNLRSISLLSTASKAFEKIILKIVQKLLEERNLLNASRFRFRAGHSTTLQ
jgi:hypothetical protein